MKKILHNFFIRHRSFVLILIFLSFSEEIFSQLVINPGGAAALATQLAGPGLSVFNVTYSGSPIAAASFTANGTNLGINAGILLATGNATVAIGPNNSAGAGVIMGLPGSFDLDTLAGTLTFDASILEFDFIPQNDTVSFRYVFASEEYPEYVCSPFNDVFVFYITGPGITGYQNMALIPGTNQAVAINSVNSGVMGTFGIPGVNCGLGYSNLYVNNTPGPTIQYDGFTKVMTAKANVIPCQTYHLRLAIADAGDGQWDSGVFLEEGSLTTVPVVNAGPDISICGGQTINLGAAPIAGWTYSWSPSTGLSNPNISNPTLTVNPAGGSPVNLTYAVTATKGSCVLTDTVNITINPIATSSFIPTVTTACISQPVQFAYTGNAPANANYNWNFGGGSVISGSGQGPYYVSYPNAGTYTISLIVNVGGCPSPVTTAQVTVNLPPVATFTIPATACPHDTVTINFSGHGTATSIAQWNFNGANVISGSGLGPYQLTFNTAGNYIVALDISDQGCTPSHFTQMISVGNIPAYAGPDISACSLTPVNIGSTNVPGTIYSWSPSAGLSNPNISNPVVTISNGGTTPITSQYLLTITRGNCVGYDTVSVTSIPPPVATFTVPNASCLNDVLTVNFTGQYPTSTNYTWNFNGANIISGTGIGPYQISYNSLGPHTITLNMSVNGCPPVQYSQTVTVGNSPAAAGPDLIYCSGSAVSIGGAGTAGMNYTWSPATGLSNPGISNPSVTLTNTGNTSITTQYILTATNANCFGTDTVNVTVVPPPTAAFTLPPISCVDDVLNINFTGQSPATTNYQWNFNGANIISGSGLGPYQVSYNSAGAYSITLDMNNSGCPPVQYSQTVTVGNSPAIAGPDISYCSGTPVNIGVNGNAGMNYSWSPSTGLSNPNISNPSVTLTNNGSIPVTQQYILTSVNGSCSGSDTVDVTVIPQPVASFTIPGASCLDDLLNIQFTGNSPASTIYQWSFTGANVISGNGLGPYQVSYSNIGTYNVTLDMSVNGCPPVQYSQSVIVGNSPASAGADLSYCSGTAVNIGTTGNSGVIYSWSPATGLSNPNIANPSVTTTNTGNMPIHSQYILTATNGNCSGSDTVDVIVNPQPLAAINNLPDTICSGEELQIAFTGNAGTNAQLNWNFSSGSIISGNGSGPYQVQFNNVGSNAISLGVNEFGCTSSINDNIFIEYMPAASFTLPPASCSGDTVQLNFNGTYSASSIFNWDFGNANVISGNGTGPYTLAWGSSGIYPVNLTVSNGNCISHDTHNIFVGSYAANAGPDSTFCSGATVNIGSVNATGFIYQWTPSTGLSNAAISNPSVTINNPGNTPAAYQYILTASNGNCNAIDTVDLIVNPIPVSSFTSLPDTICAGDITQFNYNGITGSNAIFNWNFSSGNIISGNGSGPYTVQYSLGGTYTITLDVEERSCVSTTTRQIVARNLPDPSFTIAPSACFGDTIQVNYTGIASQGNVYNWNFGNANLISGTGAGPLLLSYDSAGTFPVGLNVVNGNCQSQNLLNISVTKPNVNAGYDQSYCSGITISIGSSGDSNYVYTWSPSTGISNVNDHQPFVTLINNSNSPTVYDYICTAVVNGCVAVDTVSVTVRPWPIPSLSALPDTICIGQQLQVSYTGTAAINANFNWNFGNATLLSGSGSGPYSIDFPSAGFYPISLAVDQFGCNALVNDSVVVNAPVTAQFSLPPHGCLNETLPVNYTGNGGNANYIWNFTGANIVSGSGNGPFTISYPAPGDYVVSLNVHSNVCPGDQMTDSISITVPTADGGPDSITCAGNPVSIGTNAQAGYHYQWTPASGLTNANSAITSVISTGNSQNIVDYYFQLLVTDSFGCTNTDSVLVTFLPKPELRFASPPPQCLLGNNFSFTAVGFNQQGIIYHWNFGANASIDSSNSATTPPVSYSVAGSSDVTLYGTYNGCEGPHETHTVTVIEMPEPDFIPDIYEGCQPLTVHFTNLNSSTTTIYSWLIEGNTIGSHTTDWTFNNPGTYEVDLTAVNTGGCSTTMKKPQLINVYALPVADFISSPSYSIYPETEINFSNLSQGAEYTYWEFGDGSTETFYQGKHNYADTGTYRIILYISTNHGCKDTIDGTIRIDGGFSFFIPTAFSPNQDGVNDAFQGYGTFLDSYKMWIYDRWGLLIYFTDDYNKPWDGSMNSPVQNDVYVYRIIAEDLKGEEHIYVGSVTLVH